MDNIVSVISGSEDAQYYLFRESSDRGHEKRLLEQFRIILKGRSDIKNIGLVCDGGNSLFNTGYQTENPDLDLSTPVSYTHLDVYKRQTWNAADNGYFRGGGFSSRFVTKAEMPATMIRLNLVKGLGPVLQIAEGWTVNPVSYTHLQEWGQETEGFWNP